MIHYADVIANSCVRGVGRRGQDDWAFDHDQRNVCADAIDIGLSNIHLRVGFPLAMGTRASPPFG